MAHFAKRIAYQLSILIVCICMDTTVITQDTATSALKDFALTVDSSDNKESVFIETRKIPDSIINRLKNDDAFWYANALPEKSKKTPEKKNAIEKLYQKEWVRNLLWTLFVGCFIALIIWFLINSNLKLFSAKPKRVNALSDDAINNNIFSINFDDEIAAATQKGDHRLAVRLLYLQVLKMLADAALIKYSLEKTNSDYLHELKFHLHYTTFFKLTRDFEYVWYGQFFISKAVFEKMQQDFTLFKNNLGH